MPCRATNPHYLRNHPPISDHIHRSYQLTNGVSLHSTSGQLPSRCKWSWQSSQFQGSHELHVHVPREATHAPSQHYQALTANGLTCTCKLNPIGPAPLPTPTIDCSLQVQGANGAIPTQQNHQSPSLQPHKLTNNTSTLQVVEPSALLQMGLPDPALQPVGEPTQAGVNRCQWRCRPHTTSSPHKVLNVHPPLSKQWNHKPSLQVLHTLRPATWTNGVSSLTASGQYHWTH